jgi:3-oxoadipate enol-lactonase
MPILETSDAAIFFETHGESGHWVTLINGHTRSSSDFRMMARQLLESGKFRVLLFDNRASGKSEARGQFTLSDMCADVRALWDHLLIPKSAVLGISMGGVIAQGLAIEVPTRVSKLILVSSAPEESFINSTGGGWIAEGNFLEEKMRSYFAPSFVDRNPILFLTMIKQIRQALISGAFAKKSELQRNALRGVTWTNRLNQITAPTLIIHGEMDQVVDPAAAKIFKNNIRDSQLSLIPNAGHLLLAEAPKELYRLVIDFLR